MSAFSDVGELVDNVELDDVVHYRYAAYSNETGSGQPFGMQVFTRSEGDRIEVRLNSRLATDEVEYQVDSSAVYVMAEAREVSETLLREFAERVAVLAVYPYIREGMMQLAGRMNQPRPILPMMRAGRIQLSAQDYPETTK